MKIHFLGAARTVTGSQYLIEVNGKRLLMECGMFQGHRDEAIGRNLALQFDPHTLDAAILSHAHIDHSGNLPILVAAGYEGPIYATHATRDLVDLMLMDSAHIQEADAEYINEKNLRHGLPPVKPLYTRADAARVAQYTSGVDYETPFEVIPGVQARFHDAGHILGSASIELTIHEKGKTRKMWFSGDIGRPDLPLVKDPVLPENDLDILMMECTYGDRIHADPRFALKEFEQVVARTVARRGKVIIPAFAVGRTQELVFALNEMMSAGSLPRVPVYVDSPLAVHTSSVYMRHLECFDDETQQFVKENRHPALDFDMLTYIQTVDESKALNDRKDPMVIISASGMAEVGRILHHLKNNIEEPRNTIVIVSWQAPNTLGRRLAEREKEVRIFGQDYTVKAEVVTIGGLSAHAGQTQLMEYAKRGDPREQLLFIHGEPAAYETLAGKLKGKLRAPVAYPDLHQVYDTEEGRLLPG
jgi:metallo-beta-lactamase family protein